MAPETLSNSQFLSEENFVRRLHMEQRRTERSRRPFVLVLLESANLLKAGQRACKEIQKLLLNSFRETDIRGWYQNGCTLGLIFTEIGPGGDHSVGSHLVDRVRALLASNLNPYEAAQIQVTFYLFPEDWDKWGGLDEPILYPEAARSRKPSKIAKRFIDIAGSLSAIVIGAPLFAAAAIAIKMTSQGPVVYRQKRVGRYGRSFTLFKFRSMRVDNDHAVHREYVRNLIAGSVESAGTKKIFKLTNDPRITAVGKLLRRTSIDEIPQFFNVLFGDMSLVGPRPPIPYEVDSYEIWHRRRLLSVKPGITGLWQVNGRSRTTFDEMVRLDLQYSRTWSVWMDLKILLQTPRAVIIGEGAH